jgi:hypothetical protein
MKTTNEVAEPDLAEPDLAEPSAAYTASLNPSPSNPSPSNPVQHQVYQPLPEEHYIRVPELEPGRWHEPIVCTLKCADLWDHHDSYEAISYAWGDAKDCMNIECNGNVMRITRSLHGALRRLRYEAKPRLLWADFLCINQNDIEEREK